MAKKLASSTTVATVIGITLAATGELGGFDMRLACNYFRKLLRKQSRGDATGRTVEHKDGTTTQGRKRGERVYSGMHRGTMAGNGRYSEQNVRETSIVDMNAVEDLVQAAYLAWHTSQRGKDGGRPISLSTIQACWFAQKEWARDRKRVDKLAMYAAKQRTHYTCDLTQVQELLPHDAAPIVRDVCGMLSSGYTQTEIAERLDVNQSTISRIGKSIRKDREQARVTSEMMPTGNGYYQATQYPLSCRIGSSGIVTQPRPIASVHLSGAVGVKDDSLPVRLDDTAWYSGSVRAASTITGPSALDPVACPILTTAPRYSPGATDGRTVADLPDEYLDQPYTRLVRRMPIYGIDGAGI